MIKKITGVNISPNTPAYTVHDIIKQIPDLDQRYTTPESRANSVSTFGSSKASSEILGDIQLSPLLIKDVITDGKNIVHGGGSYGLMGTFISTGKKYSAKDDAGKPLQNLAIIMNPPYGDEDIHSCIPIGTASSEEERIGKFMQVADTFLVQKGSTATLKETSAVIGENKNVILIGKEFFEGLKKQYKQIFSHGFTEYKPEDLFIMLNAKKDRKTILEEINNPSRVLNNLNFIKKAKSEPIAIKTLPDCYVVYQGGIETLKKAISLVQLNDYTHGHPQRPVLFVSNFFNGLKEQYQSINNAKLLKHKPEELFKFISLRDAKKFGRLL